MPNQMDSDEFGSYEMRVDGIRSYSERVDSLIRSETASFYGEAPLYTFASRVDSAIRSSSASYEADYEPRSSTTSNLPSQDLSLPDSHNNPYYQILTQQPHFRYQGKGLNSKDGNKEENAFNGLSGTVSFPSMLPTPQTEDEILQPSKLKIFTFIELKTATRNFHPVCLLGKGGWGTVFKGWIDEKTFASTERGTGIIIVVKRLEHGLLFQGHSELLNYNAKLFDCGFVTNLEEDGIYPYTYLDIWDRIYTGRQTKKSYVYSFGVVLLELMSGRRALDLNRPMSEHNLVEWARPFLMDKRKIPRVMDARMEGQYSYREAKRIANLALDCLSLEQVIPNMDEVVRSLEHLQHSKDT
ncbi:hypothetical protein Fmac_014618 [Flemingia macrophylla]|uniref:Protein kinase domain-containing protein n=1 Tax=Flemingia macrophylla TaxID=520843 RepID=A0ABD1MCA1_9FABA